MKQFALPLAVLLPQRASRWCIYTAVEHLCPLTRNEKIWAEAFLVLAEAPAYAGELLTNITFLIFWVLQDWLDFIFLSPWKTLLVFCPPGILAFATI